MLEFGKAGKFSNLVFKNVSGFLTVKNCRISCANIVYICLRIYIINAFSREMSHFNITLFYFVLTIYLNKLYSIQVISEL